MAEHKATRVGSAFRTIAALTLFVLALLTLRIFVTATVVHGTSMNPTYVTGDLLIATKSPTYKIGDVITYHPQEIDCNMCNVVHRIVRGNAKHGWITQGDNNPAIDGWLVHDNEIGGKVIVHLRVPKVLQLLYLPNFWMFLATAAVSVYLFLRYFDSTEVDEELLRQRGRHRQGGRHAANHKINP